MSNFVFKAGDHIVTAFNFSGLSIGEVTTRLCDLIDGMLFFLPDRCDRPSFDDLWKISGWLLEDDPDPCGFKLAYLDIVIVPVDDDCHEVDKPNIRILNHGVFQSCTNICDDTEELPFS